MSFAWEKYASILCWLHPPCIGLGFTAGFALSVVSWASFWTRLSRFTTKCFSKQEVKVPLIQLAGPSQTHQVRTESRQVCEPPALHLCAAMPDPSPTCLQKAFLVLQSLALQSLAAGCAGTVSCFHGCSFSPEDQAGECVTYPLAKGRFKVAVGMVDTAEHLCAFTFSYQSELRSCPQLGQHKRFSVVFLLTDPLSAPFLPWALLRPQIRC